MGESRTKTQQVYMLQKKLEDQKQFFIKRVKDKEAKLQLQEEALVQIRQANHAMIAAAARKYGKLNDKGDYELELDTPETGWITMGGKNKDTGVYTIIAKKVGEA